MLSVYLCKQLCPLITYRARVKERKAFQLHQKEKPASKGRTMLQCPTLGPSPTVTCPLRELALTSATKERPQVDGTDLPNPPGAAPSAGWPPRKS
jgi:hypothetical protein